jgi:hypothetical protein
MAFGREPPWPLSSPEKLIHAFDWEDWKKNNASRTCRHRSKPVFANRSSGMLGKQPDTVENAGQYHIKTEDELGVPNWSRDRWNPRGN